jgi:hypothetical protein
MSSLLASGSTGAGSDAATGYMHTISQRDGLRKAKTKCSLSSKTSEVLHLFGTESEAIKDYTIVSNENSKQQPNKDEL